jgi:hypothetical protein
MSVSGLPRAGGKSARPSGHVEIAKADVEDLIELLPVDELWRDRDPRLPT